MDVAITVLFVGIVSLSEDLITSQHNHCYPLFGYIEMKDYILIINLLES